MSRYVHAIVTSIGVVDAITCRNSCRLAVSAQCRSSSTTNTGRLLRRGREQLGRRLQQQQPFRVRIGDARRSSAPTSGTSRANAPRCAGRNPATNAGSPSRTSVVNTSIHG